MAYEGRGGRVDGAISLEEDGSRRRRLCEDGARPDAIDARKRTREHEPSPGAQSVEKRGGALQRFRDASLQSDVPAAFDTCR